jgi:hypothetical protein
MLKVYVRTRHLDHASAERVRQNAVHYGDLDISVHNQEIDYWDFLRTIVRDCPDPYFVACHDDVVLPRSFGARVRGLIAELAQNGLPWGMLGNAGISLDGKQIFRFINDPLGTSGTSPTPLAVAMLDGNCLLINRQAWQESGVGIPALSGYHGYDIALAAECWRAGLPVFADRRLFVIHHGRGNLPDWHTYVTSPDFVAYWLANFGATAAITINGIIQYQGQSEALPLPEAVASTIERYQLGWAISAPVPMPSAMADLDNADFWADLLEMQAHAGPINHQAKFPLVLPTRG